MSEIKVELKERAYTIFVEKGILGKLNNVLEKKLKGANVLLVTDDCVKKIYAEKLVAELAKISSQVAVFDFPAGEESKKIGTLEMIYRAVVRNGLDRKSVIVALGGGVVGDIAGFAAATYMRGISYIQIPTTLLAMVDSSVGGKTAIDLTEGKNLVGAFWQPMAVIADPTTLSSLPHREINCGLAEVVKYGVIMDNIFFEFLEKNSGKIKSLDMHILTYIIAKCCELKAQIVSGDEREESGLRAILNLGHTFGHAIETVTEFGKFHHGEAVSIGMEMAAKFAVLQGMMKEDDAKRITALLREFSLPVENPGIEPEKLVSAMKKDKKNSGGKIKLILPSKIGSVSIVDSDEKHLLDFLRKND